MSNIEINTAAQLAPGALLFEEGFESPIVPGYLQGVPFTGWIGASDGFGSERIGQNNANSGDWVSPGPSDAQGIDPNYTNSGAITEQGLIGPININTVTYRFTITVAYDKFLSGKEFGAPSGNYDVILCAIEPELDLVEGPTGVGSRSDLKGPGTIQRARSLIELTGSVGYDDLVHTFVGTYTTDPVNDIGRNGYDLAVAIVGATSSAIITSVKVEQLPGARRVNWSPDQISTIAWFDAADRTTINDGGAQVVEQWDDKSGNANHVTQPTLASRPYTFDRTINGLNTLEAFDGEFLSNAGAIISGNPDLLIATVKLNDTNLVGPNDMLVTFGPGVGGQFIGMSNGSGNRSFRFFDGYEAYSAVDLGNPHIQIGVRPSGGDYASSQMFIDGTEDARSGGTNDTATPNVGAGMNILGGIGGFTDGLLGEVIVTNDNSLATRWRIEGYLAHKWGLTANLPSDHPYKDAAPTVLWTPADTDTVTWHDAAAPSTVDEAATLTWFDKSGNGNHATQANAGAKPAYDAVGKKFTYDGSDILKVANDPYKNLQNFAVVAIGSWGQDSENNNAFASHGGSGSLSGQGWNFRQRLGLCFTLRGATTINDTGGGVEPPFATEFIGAGMRDPSNDIYSRIDGTQTYSANNAAAVNYTATNVSAIGGVYQADNWANPSFYLRSGSTLKELVVINNATVAAVEKVEGYLAHKWGLTANLPPSHPYKIDPPHI